MANLDLDATERDNFFKIWGSIIRGERYIDMLRRYMKFLRIMVIENFDVTPRFNTWVFTAGELYLDTDNAAKVYVKIVANGGNWDIELHKNSTRTNLVSKATNVANGATGTLVAQTGFKLAGTVKLVTGAADSTIDLQLVWDHRREAEFTFPNQSTDENEKGLKDDLTGHWNSAVMRPLELLHPNGWKVGVDRFWWRDYVPDLMKLSTAERQEGLVVPEYTDDTTGRTLKRVKGILEKFNQAMKDNTVAITIQRNIITVGTVVASPNNVGTLAIASLVTATREHLLTGTGVVECTDETIGSEVFRLQHVITDELNDGIPTKVMVAAITVKITKVLEDYLIGIKITPTRAAVVETGDDGNMLSVHSISGETSTNMDNGKIYIKVTRNAGAPIWLIEAFKAASQQVGDKIGEQTTDGTVGSVVLTLTGLGLTWTFTFDKAAANIKLPVATNTDSDIILDIKVCKKGDRWEIPITNDEKGLYQMDTARNYHTSFNSSGAPNVDDNFALTQNLVNTNP